MLNVLWERLRGRYQRDLSRALWRRPLTLLNSAPLVSFTFDDFPRSALQVGGRILTEHGVAGTYYVSLSLLDRDEPVGRICSTRDLVEVLAQGHELGCHTFAHCDAWATSPRVFERSILQNRQALNRLLPGARFSTMSYPINSPRPATKRRAGRHFTCCRGGGQRTNIGTIDVNYLQAFFLEQSRDRPSVIWGLLERNTAAAGWLIFVTHDVAGHPSRYGCTPAFFTEVVRRTVASGAKILPVSQALAEAHGFQGTRPCQEVAAAARRRSPYQTPGPFFRGAPS